MIPVLVVLAIPPVPAIAAQPTVVASSAAPIIILFMLNIAVTLSYRSAQRLFASHKPQTCATSGNIT
jgi:hypothetical protein